MKQYIVDAFTEEVFHGNPAAVCILDEWPSDELMLNITKENNLSETAFALKTGDRYHLRWFTPGGEIDLCGHATLATSFVILNYYDIYDTEVRFDTLSGELIVRKSSDMYEMDFPSYELTQVQITHDMVDAIGARPIEAYMGRDLLCVFENEDIIRKLQPDQEKLMNIDGLLLQATARGTDTDSFSRTFAPKLKIVEDPVCGSGHCHIVPYWAKKLGKDDIVSYQASSRGGTLYCRMNGDRVKIAGKAALYSVSELMV